MKNRRAFITGIKSYKLNSSEKKFLKKFKPWGVILFSRNIKSIDQTKKLTESVKKIFNDNNYPILIDQEGGRVNRLNKIISFDTLTSEYFGNLFKKDKFKFNIIYKMFIDQTSYLLKLIGANINTVPVLDTRVKGSSNIIGDRAYSNNPKLISKLGDFCIKYFHRNSIGTIMKHIPGHGEAKVDSHYFTPIVKKKLSKLIKEDFSPFKNKKCFFAMTAHVVYKDIDKSNTATHSKKMIALIRNKIGFKNILISDDLSMKSLKKDLEYNTLKTFTSGCNIALHCNGNIKEMVTVASNSPLVNKFIIQKTSEFYKILR
ncbi:glycoside hydrolase family 3 N-terminal domain-containing protein [Candidatus Pelagibacter sp.]|uniref:glycoside hydrolase family 3 N-terminal domain-containing protein n=1 Tax=Candidatus Pelagibacter sp. TaxID=2024849 RepID=UPI003F833197